MRDFYSAAYDALREIYRDGAYSQLKLNQILKAEDVENPQLVTKIVYGVLDNNVYLETFVKQLAPHRPKNAILVILKIGIYLLKFLKSVPDYAVVNNAVNQAKRIGKRELAGFVNAVLKRALETEIVYPKGRCGRLSVQYSYPEWFVRRMIAQYGEELAEEFVAYRTQGKTCVRVNRREISAEGFENLLLQSGVSYEKAALDATYYVSHSTLISSKIPTKYYVNQGISSILVCRGMGVKNGDRVLDACAAPGGKAALLAELNPAGSVEAWDVHAHRVQLIEKYVARLRLPNVKTKIQDATKLCAEAEESYDAVLCDVPCSGFGVAYEKPDIKLARSEEDISALSGVQYRILKTCAGYVKPGGIMMYSTCTVLEEENRGVVERFLAEARDFSLQPVALDIVPKLRLGDYVQLLPCLDGVQGFFMAKLRREESGKNVR